MDINTKIFHKILVNQIQININLDVFLQKGCTKDMQGTKEKS